MSDAPWTADLHLRLARREGLHHRLTQAATLAAAGAALGWALGLEPLPHALLLVAAGVAGALVRVGSRPDQAWRTIADQAGLAYQTHVEHAGRDDPYGLLAAASVQARLSIRGVIPPRRSPWWLPLASLAVAMWLLGALIGTPAAWWSPATPDVSQAGSGPPTPAPPTLPDAEREPDEPQDGVVEAEEPETGVGSPPRSPEPATSSADEGGDGAGDGLERDALDRFLDALRERPRSAESEAQGLLRDAEPGDVSDDRDADLARAELREDDRRDGDDDGRTASDPGDDDREPDGTSELPGDGGDGEREDADGDATDDAGGGPAEPAAEGDETGEGSEVAAPPEDGDAPAQADGGEEGPPDAGLGGEQPGLDEGSGDDAGMGPGAPIGAQDLAPEPGGDLEALPGLLGPGPEALGGRVRLPGRGSEVVPEGPAAAALERAIEQAVTDGSVPVTYQEIIRNYFR